MATLFELLGVTTPDDAAAKWPKDRVQPDLGELAGGDAGFPELMTYLESALRFRALRPGAAQAGLDPDQPVTVGLTAELHVTPPPAPPGPTLLLAQMPKLGYRLEATHDVPAHLFVTQGAGGIEVAVHGLPVTIFLPPGFITPKREPGDGTPLPDVRVAPPPPPDGPIEGFDANHPDSLEIVLSDEDSSRIRVRVNVRMTELGDFTVDPVVPISFGECRLSGLPMTALHDLQIVPQPVPQGVAPEHADAELPLEWKRHRLDLFPGTRGLVSIRTLDLDMTAKPWSLLADKIHAKRSGADPVEFVVEDLAVPIVKYLVAHPIPVHARVGLRRQVLAGDAGGENYNLTDAPVDLEIGPLVIRLFRILLQTTDLEGETPIAFDAVIQSADDEPSPARWAFPLSFTDDGVLTFGVVLPAADRPRLFTVFGREVRIAGARLGCSLAAVKALVEGDGSAKDAFIALVDLELRKEAATNAKSAPATLKPKTGEETSQYLEGLGWRLGKPTFGSVYDPTGLKLLLFDKFPLHIEEIGFVTEDNGGFYFSVSARLEEAFGPAEKAPSDEPPPDPATPHGPCARPSAGRAEALKRGIGLRLHRLRTRVGGNADAPRFLLDGLTLFVSIGRAELSGFGALAEFDLGGNHYEESAFGLQVCFPALGKHWDLGFQMYRGRVTGIDEFTYGMFAAVVGGIPLGSAELSGLRAIVVRNLAPRLPPADGTDQPMRLYRWYKENLGAVELPQHRAMTAWGPRDHSFAWGAAASVSFAGTKAVRLDGFFFMMDSPDEEGFVGGLELYALKAPKPIAFAAFEWDATRDKWGLTIGFSVGIEALFGNVADVLGDITVAGLLFFGNKPDTIAIGQYNDTATWPSLRLNFTRLWKLEVFVGFCYHRVDAADALDPTTESIRVVGAIVSAKGSVKFGIGTFKIYFTLSWVSGQWRTEAIATGHVLVIAAGIRIRLFGCFNFGASVKLDHAVLGPGPTSYRRTSTIIRIETPWWLPDVTVRWECTSGTATPEAMPVLTCPLVRALAIGPGSRAAVALGVAGTDPETAPVVHTFDEARALPSPTVTDDAFAALPLVGCDSEIALDFKVSLDASATVLPPTPDGAGRQDSNELSVTYELVSVGIRRRRRFADAPNAWADLLDPLTTELDAVLGLPPSAWQAHFQSEVGFDWDADVQRVDRLDPRRLLLNAITPYSFLSGNPEGDEVIAETQPGWPCCTPTRPRPRWHVVDFADTAAGTRTPATETFTHSSSTFHWIGGRPPVVVPPSSAPAGAPVARIPMDPRVEGVVVTASFDQPVRICEVHAYWSRAHSHAQLVVEGYRGLERVVSRSFEMALDDPGVPIRFDEPLGLTSLLLRKTGRPTASGDKAAFVELVMVRYRTLADERRAEVDRMRCQAREDHVHGKGRLAWLPNTDYEVTVRTRAVLGYTRTGEQEAFVEQKAFFRTKGLPGLNAVARAGEELEPYVESVYPPPGTTLYRTEPLALAFNERFGILAPIDRTPSPNDPLERQTMMRWGLAIEKPGGDGLERVSATGPDWIVEHRTAPLPLPPRRPAIFDTVLTTPVRRARSQEPLRMRLDRMIARPGGCGEPGASLHTSQVLVHAPYDPAHPDAARPRWEAGREYRANLRLEHGPFVDRAPFVAEDAGAFSGRTEHGPGAAWTFDAGAMHAPAGTDPALPQFAVFGDAAWNHVQIVAGVDPGGGAAGVAVAIRLAPGGAVERALVAWVDERGGARLRVEARENGSVVESREVPLPPNTPRPYVLEVAAFDDVLRAGVSGAEVALERARFRDGHMALAALGDGRIARLTVTALDGYRVHFTASRYDDFEAHIGSHDGSYAVVQPGDLGAPGPTVVALLAETSADIDRAMTAGSDSAPRERLFARWVADLALPLRTEPRRLSIARYGAPGATDLLIVESPEPLPLGGDVSLVIRKRRPVVPPFPRPPRPLPPIVSGRATVDGARRVRDVERWIEEIDLADDGSGGRSPPLPPELEGVRRLVRAQSDGRDVPIYRVYELRRGARRGESIAIVPVEIRRGDGGDPALAAMADGDLALLDARGRHLIPPLPSPLPPAWVDVPLRILGDASGHRALVIPVGADPSVHAALASGAYRLVFSIDRARWRAEVPDASSSYRAAVTLSASW
jgi:hypothetical protein